MFSGLAAPHHCLAVARAAHEGGEDSGGGVAAGEPRLYCAAAAVQH